MEGVRQMSSQMVRITVRPEWVSVLDFETRFPAPAVSVYEERRHSWVSVPEDAERWRRDPA